MPTIHKDQSLIVAIDAHAGCYLLSALGDQATGLLDDVGCDLADFGFDEDDHPREPGVHVWEGSLVISSYKDDEGIKDVDQEWDGTWRPATLADFARFGLAVPQAGGDR